MHALVTYLLAAHTRTGARFHDVQRLSDVLAMSSADRHVLSQALATDVEQGSDDLRSVALWAMIRVLEGAPAGVGQSVRTCLRRNHATNDADSYWRSFAGLALALAELAGERPRRLRSLELARELFEVLLDGWLSLARAAMTEPDASELFSALGGLMRLLKVDYFDSRGISVTTGGPRADEHLLERVHQIADGLTIDPEPVAMLADAGLVRIPDHLRAPASSTALAITALDG
jgi:hypothetical protein